MPYLDAILHIADLPALAAALPPDRLDESGAIAGFDATPAVRNGAAALVYVRVPVAEAEGWRGLPGVTVLAEAPHGPGAADALYAGVFAAPAARALYDAVYPRTLPHEPERFGVLA
jgi:hypothetical protein